MCSCFSCSPLNCVLSILTLAASVTGRVGVAVTDLIVDAAVDVVVFRAEVGVGVGDKAALAVAFENDDVPLGVCRGVGLGARLDCAFLHVAELAVLAVAVLLFATRFVVDVTAVIDAWLGDRLSPGVPEGGDTGSAPELEATLLPVLVELRVPGEPEREGVEGDLRICDVVLEGERDFVDEVIPIFEEVRLAVVDEFAEEAVADLFKLSGIAGRCFVADDGVRAVFVRDDDAGFVLPAESEVAVVAPVVRPVEADNDFFVPAAAVVAGLAIVFGDVVGPEPADAVPVLVLAAPCFDRVPLLLGRGSILSDTPPPLLSSVGLGSVSAGGNKMMGSFERCAPMSFLDSSDTGTW